MTGRRSAAVVLAAVGSVAACWSVAPLDPADTEPQTSIAVPAFLEAITKSRATIEPRLRVHPGLAVAVAVNGTIVWSEARGWADIERRVPATPATRFRLYSVFKPMTAVLALRLAEDGRIALDTPIGQYLRDVPPAISAITLSQLMTHTSGVRHYRPGEWLRVSRASCGRAADALAPFISDPLLFAPGARTEYSSFGYVLASAVLEVATGRSFFALAADDLLSPLGMASTVPDDPGTADPLAATPYDSETPLQPSSGINNTCKAGAGGFRGTAEDVVRFGMALLDGTRMPPAVLARLGTPAPVRDGENAAIGFGIGLANAEGLGRVLVQSGGAIGGRALLLVAPDRRIVVALASNFEGESFGTDAGAVARAFAQVRR
jgi:CubicO group peptidase (beta-lactamase class C family)